MSTYDPDLLDAVESLPSKDWRGVGWRHMFNDYRPERVNTSGARWNPRDTGAIYVALDRATALAEGQHLVDIQPRRIYRRRVLYKLALDVPDVIDLSVPGALASIGVGTEDIVSDNFSACQRIGGAAAWLQRGGLFVPSARNDGTNLVILVGTGDSFDMDVLEEEVVDAPAHT